ncbi:MAG: amidohydrolase family protein [Gemmatimonadota bacterium]
MAVVEAHAHLYAEDDGRYPPGTENPYRPPPGTGTVAHLERLRREVGITHAVAVQTHSFYRHDNRLMADAVAANRAWMTGVCNLPSGDPGSPDELERLARGGVRGLRLEYPQTGGPFYHAGSAALCARARDLGLVVNVHAGGTDHYPGVDRLLTEYPELIFCLDHCGYAKPEQPEVLANVLALVGHRNLHLKMSFWAERDAEYARLGRRLLEAYGPDRCMWGGNFPAELWHPQLSYADHLAVLRDDICRSATEREAVLSSTPLRVWFPEQA